jgi:hypothetical protein
MIYSFPSPPPSFLATPFSDFPQPESAKLPEFGDVSFNDPLLFPTDAELLTPMTMFDHFPHHLLFPDLPLDDQVGDLLTVTRHDSNPANDDILFGII